MLALLFTLLLLGPCAPSEQELLFCEGIGCAALELGDGGAGGDAGSGHGGEGGGDADAGAGGGGGEGGAEDPGSGGAGGEGGVDGCIGTMDCDDGNPCNGFEVCDAKGTCIMGNGPLPVSDGNRCTRDLCREGLPHYEPVDVDDGDPCTRDGCHTALGVYHDPIDGCHS